MTKRLGTEALVALRGSVVRTPAYDVQAVVPTVVHIGPGVFHRAHQAVYADTVLGTGATAGGICAVSLRSTELRETLRAQDHLYSVVERGDDADRVRIVGSIRESLVAPEDPERVLWAMTDEAVSVVSMTVTEKGYCAVASSGALDLTRDEIAHDLASPSNPQSLPGFLVEALVRRRQAGIAPFTVVSCDNLRSNGAATRRVVTELAEHRGGDLADWIRGTVAFPSSMVDRMVPGATDDVRSIVRASCGYLDRAAVAAEPFSQWVLEDTFPTGRPSWEAASVEFVDDVEPFEQAKLRILNGAHSALAYFGLLSGYAAMADAARDEVLRSAVLAMLETEVIPTVTPPRGVDLSAYAGQVVERFGNRALGYTTAKVADDGSHKLPVRIVSTMRDRRATGSSVDGLAAVLAAFAACVAGPRCASLRLDDPALDELLGVRREPESNSDVAVERLLSLPQIFGDLSSDRAVVDVVRRQAAKLWNTDPRSALCAT